MWLCYALNYLLKEIPLRNIGHCQLFASVSKHGDNSTSIDTGINTELTIPQPTTFTQGTITSGRRIDLKVVLPL